MGKLVSIGLSDMILDFLSVFFRYTVGCVIFRVLVPMVSI